MKKGDNLFQIRKQRDRNDQKTGESNSDASRTWEQEKTPIVNQSWIENMMVHVLSIPSISFPFRFALKAKHGYVGALELVVGIKRYLEPRNKRRHRDWRYPLRNTGSLRNDDGDCEGKA